MRVCKGLQILVPVRLVVCHVLSESLYNVLIEPLGLLVCLRIAGRVEIVLGAQHCA